MQCGSIVLSLLLLATVCHAQLGIGAGAALAAGIAGVGALGVLGGAAAALSLRGRRRGGIRRGGRRFRGRGRRAVLERGDADADDVEEESVIWGSVAAADQDGCALKLICLLEAAADAANDDEKAVLNLVGDLDDGAKTVATASKLPYEMAGWLGKTRGADACEVVYGTQCTYSKVEMMQIVSSVWSSVEAEEAEPKEAEPKKAEPKDASA